MELFALLFFGVLVLGGVVLGGWWIMAAASLTLAQLLLWIGLGTGVLTGLLAWLAPANPYAFLSWEGTSATNAAKIALPFLILAAAVVAHLVGL